MSVGQVGAMALAAMLSGEMDANKLDADQFKLVQEELKVYSIEVNTQKDLASVLGDLDLGEGKKIDMASLPKYAGLVGKNKVVTDAGSVERMGKDEILSIVNTLDKYMEDSLDFSDGGLLDKVNNLSIQQREEVSYKYFELIKGKKLKEEEKGRIMMAVVLE